jgi:hypothetical protein
MEDDGRKIGENLDRLEREMVELKEHWPQSWLTLVMHVERRIIEREVREIDQERRIRQSVVDLVGVGI